MPGLILTELTRLLNTTLAMVRASCEKMSPDNKSNLSSHSCLPVV